MSDQLESSDENAEELQEPQSNRARNIVAAIATVAILAVLVYAILDNGSNSTPDAPPTVVDELSNQDGSQATVQSDVELGSLSVAGYACPEPTTKDDFCVEGQPIPLEGAVFTLDDGTTYAVSSDMRMQDGTYALLNIPVGEYTLTSASIKGPEGALLRNVLGPVTVVDNGWRISNLDPNQPAIVQIVFVPDDGTPAVG